MTLAPPTLHAAFVSMNLRIGDLRLYAEAGGLYRIRLEGLNADGNETSIDMYIGSNGMQLLVDWLHARGFQPTPSVNKPQYASHLSIGI